MKLKQAYIENFGKLSQVSFKFDDTCQIFCRENGWGKSTLAAFIKVMFYGFDGERKQSILQNERKHYSPWQGGIFGGTLTFELGGKQYQLSRTFGTSPSKDVFELREAASNLISHDFSPCLGKEIFQMDSQSFQRTMFISQNDSKNIEANSSIHAKLNSYSSQGLDIGDYEGAIRLINQKLTQLKARTNPDSLVSLKDSINQLELELRPAASMDYRTDLALGQKVQAKGEIESLRQEKEEIRKEKEGLQITIGQKQGFQASKQLSPEESTRLDCLREEFKEGVPDDSQINALLKDLQLDPGSHDPMGYGLEPEEERQLDELNRIFPQGFPRDQEMDGIIFLWRSRDQVNQQLQSSQGLYQDLEKKLVRASVQEQRVKVLIYPAILLILLGMILFTGNSLLGGMAGFLGLSLAFLYFWLRSQSDLTRLRQQSHSLAKEMDGFQAMIFDIDRQIQTFLRTYSGQAQAQAMPDILYEWKQLARQYQALKNKQARGQTSNHGLDLGWRQERARNFLLGFYRHIPLDDPDQVPALLVRLREEKKEYDQLLVKQKQGQAATEDYQAFIQGLGASQGQDILDSLNRKLNDIDNRLEQVYALVAGYDSELAALEREKDDLAEKEMQLQAAQSRYDQAQKEYGLLETTKDLLAAAKNSFMEKHRSPILAGFESYFYDLTGQRADQYQVDANMHLSVRQAGLQREIESLSTGYQDFTGLAMRLALVDAMYPGEKPFLIWDDPFVNWDTAKVKKGLSLLKDISKSYQIIYFTCHDSRQVDMG